MPGSYKDVNGTSPCQDCAAGTFAHQQAQTVCGQCAPGFYSFSGASSCTSCPVNSNSSKWGSNISDCACDSEYEPEVEEAAQWITAVTGFSSEFGKSSSQILGPPDVYPNTLQSDFAWMPAPTAAREEVGDLPADPHHWLQLVIRHPVYVSRVEIFETNAPGACVKIQLLNIAGEWATVWEGRANVNRTEARIFAPPLAPLANKTQAIRLEFNTTGWTDVYQVDAVRVVAEAQTGWVKSVAGFSTQYRATMFAAKELLGPPDTYPSYGLSPTAWTHSRVNRGVEWLELALSRPQVVGAVHIYETNAPGRCVKISLKDPGGGWDVVWKQQPPTPEVPKVSRIFAPPLAPRSYLTSLIRIEANTLGLFDFYQIDAVRVIPRTSHWVGTSCKDSRTPMDHACPSWNESTAVNSSCSDLQTTDCSAEIQKLVGPANAYPNRTVWTKEGAGTVDAWTPTPYTVYTDYGGRGELLAWVEITLDHPILVAAVSVYEGHDAGALHRIRLLDPQGNWDTVWELRKRQPGAWSSSRVLTPQLSARSYKTQQIRLEVNSTSDYAIDAVSVVEGIAPSPQLPVFMCSPVFDKDGDGSISQAEWEAYTRTFAAADSNGDGRVLAGEYQRYQITSGGLWARSNFSDVDRDSDGNISLVEWNTCRAGFARNPAGACEECAAGKYSVAGASVCTDCAAGKFSAAVGATVCADCGAGTYSAASAATVCTSI